MTDETRLLDLIVEWEERRASGERVRPEELARDCPELIESLRERLCLLDAFDSAFASESALGNGMAGATDDDPPPHAVALLSPSEDRHAIPGFELLETLGFGGMGVVYKARQTALDRIVALKMILPHAAVREDGPQRLVREAKALATLRHPNIVQIYEVGRHRSRPFLVLEYVAGESLDAQLTARPWPPAKAARLSAVLARAVAAAHRQGVVHRDLKPHNVLITPEGEPKICDFGLARRLDVDSRVTQTGVVAGTLGYLAPEQARHADGADRPAVDIHALGAILYELLTGRPPFMADNPWDVLQLVAEQDPVPPRQLQPKIPRDLETICLKCLAKQPQHRYATADELADDLERFLTHEPIRARPLSPAARLWRWCRRRPSAAALLAVAAAAVIAIVGLTLGYNARLARELNRTEAARRELLETKDDLLRTLTGEIAQRLDGDLRELAALPTAAAAWIEHTPTSDPSRLDEALTSLLAKSPRVFGVCLAMEPFQLVPDRADFALYLYRGPTGLVRKQLLPPDYQPHYRQWPWYRDVSESCSGRWTEPYTARGADGTPMVTYSAPLVRQGRFVGLVAVDLAMDYFQELRDGIDRLSLGSNAYFIVVSSDGVILSHPDDRYEFPGEYSRLDQLPLDDSFRRLRQRWTTEPKGSGRAIDFFSGEPAEFHFAHVPAAGWTVLAVSRAARTDDASAPIQNR